MYHRNQIRRVNQSYVEIRLELDHHLDHHFESERRGEA